MAPAALGAGGDSVNDNDTDDNAPAWARPLLACALDALGYERDAGESAAWGDPCATWKRDLRDRYHGGARIAERHARLRAEAWLRAHPAAPANDDQKEAR